MTPNIYKGRDLRIFVDGLPIYHATECSFSSSMKIESIATKDTQGEEGVASNYTWSLSSKGLVANAPGSHQSTKSLLELHKAGTPVTIQFRTNEAGDIIITGQALIETAAIGAPVEGSATFDAGFKGNGDYDVQEFSGASIPVVTSDAAAEGVSGAAFTYNIVGTNTPTSYAVVSVLPAGLSLNTATGVISGTPSGGANTRIVQVQAINASGTGSKIVTFSIAAA